MSAGPAGDASRFIPPLPKAVRDAAAAAEAAQATYINPEGTPPPPPQEPQTQDLREGGTVEPPAPAQTPAPTPQTPPDDPTWEQRARSALGRLETVNSQLATANTRIDSLEGLIASMQAAGTVQPATPPPPQAVTLLTPEERDEYGDTMLAVVGKRAREEVGAEIDGLKATIAQLQQRLDGVGTVISRQQVKTVYDTLSDSIPNWKAINRSPEFAEWSQQIEPYSGVQRSKLIRDAFDRHEGDRVVRFFQGFLSEAAALDPANAQPGSGTTPANGAAGNGKIPLESFAAPGRARSAPPELPPERPTYSRAQITQFWADKRRGLYKGREAEADQIERDIFQAQHEGRIT